MKWDPTADSKLFACVMKVYDVKITGTKLEEVAALMGEECTSKAVTHRLSKLRNLAHLDSSTPSTPTSSRARTSTPTTSRTRTIPRSIGKSAAGGAESASSKSEGKRAFAASNDAEAMGAYDDEDDEEVFKGTGKRLFKAEIEMAEEEGGAVKKVKQEMAEEGFDDDVVVVLDV